MCKDLLSFYGQPQAIKQTKTAPDGTAIYYVLYSDCFLRLAKPTKPKRPEPNSQTAAGIGTTVITPSNRIRASILSKHPRQEGP